MGPKKIAMSFVRTTRERRRGALGAAKSLGLASALVLGATGAVAAPARQPASAARAADLVAQMTLDEKIALVTGYFPAFSAKARGMGAKPSAGFVPGIERLGIPAQRATDASLGVSNVKEMRKGDTATALPSSLAAAASFDPELAFQSGAMIGGEARAKGFNILLAGGVNLTRDPWGGRNFEYLGEDPILAGRLAGASINGVQSNHIVSTVKHLVLNAQETGRMVSNTVIAPAALRESDLLAFELAIEGGKPGSVMCAYNKLDGLYTCENPDLLNTILKGDWGFRGWVMSDWGAVHSTEASALAGLDQESGLELDKLLNGKVFYGEALKDAVSHGRVPATRLDDMVARILVGLIETGALDAKDDDTKLVDLAANAKVAQKVAEAGSVLLRNEGQVLPLRRDLKKIVIIGGHADVGVLSGGGSSQVRSVGGVPVELNVVGGDAAMIAKTTWHASSPLKALQALMPNAQITYVDGTDPAAAAKAAADADAALVFAVQWRSEGADVESLNLPDGQEALIEAVGKANPRTVVVLESGGPVLMPWLDQVPAVLAAWYPGQGGGEAIARLLLGEVNPSGRLPITFPITAEQAPRPEPVGLDQLRAGRAKGESAPKLAPFDISYVEGANVGYRWYELQKQTPLFTFGYGLSYTSFGYSDLKLSRRGPPVVTVKVANLGQKAGADVAQVYVRAADGEGRETWRLAGFKRVELAPGEAKQVKITLEARAYMRWDQSTRRWSQPTGVLPVAVGRSASDLVLKDQWSSAPQLAFTSGREGRHSH